MRLPVIWLARWKIVYLLEAGDDPQRTAIDADEPVTRDRPDNVDDDRRGAKCLTQEQDDAQRKG